MSSIAENISAIRERIASAARRAGRSPKAIALMAVSKTQPADSLLAAYDAGQRLFGENRVQEFADKLGTTPLRMNNAEFHMIGHLQSNKAARAAELFHAVDSVDSVKLGQRLDAAAEQLGKTLDVLIEINIGGEQAKSGVSPDSAELENILAGAKDWSSLRVRGLMTVPPITPDPEGARPYFRSLCALRDRMVSRGYPSVSLEVLSMGMSHDFEVAVEEGSTCVRIGTAIFGERSKR